MSAISKAQNFETVATVAARLGELLDDVVFVGGSAAAFLITDDSIVTVRPTLDVDVIVEVVSLPEYYRFEKRLQRLGFKPDKDGPRCRFRIDNIAVDVMPDSEKILGFSNRWYRTAVKTAEVHLLQGLEIRVVSPALFLATKLEAHYGRSDGDYLGSHDMEDLLAVIDGRPSIIRDCFDAPNDVRLYLRDHFEVLLSDDDFINCLPGFVERSGDTGRTRTLFERLQGLVRAIART